MVATAEQGLTDQVVNRLAGARDPRVRAISEAVVRHLHALVREMRLTRDEWNYAIGFLTRVGAMCDDKRQEFILLSDTLGVSILVDAINQLDDPHATDSTVLGPFYVPGQAEIACGDDISGEMTGPRLFVSGSVHSTGGAPIAGAAIDVWQSDGEGLYDVQLPDTDPRGRARLRSEVDGAFHFWSRMPAAYPIPHDGPVGDMLRAQGRHPYRPAHIHFRIEAAGFEQLVTHVFAEGDPYLASDAVFAVKPSLVRAFERREPGIAPDGSQQAEPWFELRYDFRLVPND